MPRTNWITSPQIICYVITYLSHYPLQTNGFRRIEAFNGAIDDFFMFLETVSFLKTITTAIHRLRGNPKNNTPAPWSRDSLINKEE